MASQIPTPSAEARLPVWMTQAVKFGIVGVLNTALDWGVYFLLTRFTGLGSMMELAKAISYSVGVLNSYFWNRGWTFRSRQGAGKTLLPFVLVNLAGTAVNSGTLALATGLLGLPELAGLVLATVAALGWNFLTSKFLVFRK
jgi:putative flippase GtrA